MAIDHNILLRPLQQIDTSPVWAAGQNIRQDRQQAFENERQNRLEALGMQQFQEVVKQNKIQNERNEKADEREESKFNLDMTREKLINYYGTVGIPMEAIAESLHSGQEAPIELVNQAKIGIKRATEEFSGTEFEPMFSGLGESFEQALKNDDEASWASVSSQLGNVSAVINRLSGGQQQPQGSVTERQRDSQIQYYTRQLVDGFGVSPQAAQDWAFAVANDDVIVNFNQETSETFMTNRATGQTISGSLGGSIARQFPGAQELPTGVTAQTGEEIMAPSMWEASKSVGPISAGSAALDEVLGLVGFRVNDENLGNRQTLKIDVFQLIDGFKSDDRVTDSEREFILQYADPKAWNQASFQAQLVANDKALRRQRTQLEQTRNSTPNANTRASTTAQIEFIDKYLDIMSVPQLNSPDDIMGADDELILSWDQYQRRTSSALDDWSIEMLEAYADRLDMIRSK